MRWRTRVAADIEKIDVAPGLVADLAQRRLSETAEPRPDLGAPDRAVQAQQRRHPVLSGIHAISVSRRFTDGQRRFAGAEQQLRDRHAGRPVLLAEDNAVNREVVEAMLHAVHLVVDVAADGHAALARALDGQD